MNFKQEIKNKYQKDLKLSRSSQKSLPSKSEKSQITQKPEISQIPIQNFQSIKPSEKILQKLSLKKDLEKIQKNINQENGILGEDEKERNNSVLSVKKKKKGRKAKESEDLKRFFCKFDYYFSRIYLLEFDKVFLDSDSNSCLLKSEEKIEK